VTGQADRLENSSFSDSISRQIPLLNGVRIYIDFHCIYILDVAILTLHFIGENSTTILFDTYALFFASDSVVVLNRVHPTVDKATHNAAGLHDYTLENCNTL